MCKYGRKRYLVGELFTTNLSLLSQDLNAYPGDDNGVYYPDTLIYTRANNTWHTQEQVNKQRKLMRRGSDRKRRGVDREME